MPEHVTNVGVMPGASKGRARDMLARFPGGDLEARGVSRRDSEALMRMFSAARGRLPVTRVYRHVCSHNEGIGTCTVDLEG